VGYTISIEQPRLVRPSLPRDTADCNHIARACEKSARSSLGWVRIGSMHKAMNDGRMNTLAQGGHIRGFVLWSKPSRGKNKGFQVIHALAINPEFQRRGFGQELLTSVPLPVRLKCPVTVGKDEHANPANLFYAAMGFALVWTDTATSGKLLNVWEKHA